MRGSIVRVLILLVPLATLLAHGAVVPAPSGAASVRIGQVHRVVTESFVFEPDIVVDPTNPNHLAATVASADALDCDTLHRVCTPTLLLGTSQDGGATWHEQRLTTVASIDGTVAFAANGSLYEAGIENTPLPTAFVHGGLPETAGGSIGDFQFPSTPADKPWLSIDQRTGVLYLAHAQLAPHFTGVKALLVGHSTDGRKTWTRSVLPLGHSAQALPGNGAHLAVAYLGQPPSNVASAYDQSTVNVVTSPDRGKTFSRPTTIGLGWALEGTASGASNDYVAYFGGPQQAEQVIVGASKDGDMTWQSSVASGAASLFYAPVAPAPAISVAPDGTVDLLYYAATGRCTEPAAFQRGHPMDLLGRWLDPCSYNVYYTFSKDDGKHWLTPRQLNQQPLDGKGFVQIPAGRSRPGEYMGMASTNQYAYPLWIATNAAGTVADTVRIQR